MQLGVEILAAVATPLHLGNFFESWLAVPGGSLRRSLGRDEYHLSVTTGAGRRLAATGRTYICQVNLEEVGLGPQEARPAILIPADPGEAEPVFLGMRTNVYLDQDAFRRGVRLRLLCSQFCSGERPLNHPDLRLEELAPGRFLVDLTAAFRNLASQPEGA